MKFSVILKKETAMISMVIMHQPSVKVLLSVVHMLMISSNISSKTSVSTDQKMMISSHRFLENQEGICFQDSEEEEHLEEVHSGD